jgi:AcrR family transcriptional regulator
VVSPESERGDKRTRLVAAASSVFAEKGYASTRVADIAARAEVGKGTVYEYFASKEELLFAVFESINQDVAARMDSALDEGGSSWDQLERLLEIGAAVAVEQHDLQPVVLDFWAASRGRDFEEKYRDQVVSSYAFYRSMVSNFVRAGQERDEFRTDVDVDALATALVAAIDGLGIQLYFDPEIEPGRVTAVLGRLLYETLKPEPK